MIRRGVAGASAGSLAAAGASFAADRMFPTDIATETFGYGEDTPKSVSLGHLHQGCPARGCTPSIDTPMFVGADDVALIPMRLFCFAWCARHPDTLLSDRAE